MYVILFSINFSFSRVLYRLIDTTSHPHLPLVTTVGRGTAKKKGWGQTLSSRFLNTTQSTKDRKLPVNKGWVWDGGPLSPSLSLLTSPEPKERHHHYQSDPHQSLIQSHQHNSKCRTQWPHPSQCPVGVARQERKVWLTNAGSILQVWMLESSISLSQTLLV